MLVVCCGPLSAGEKLDAKGLFDRMEKKLADAETITLTVKGKFNDGAGDGMIKADLLVAQGNKVRADISMAGEGKSVEMWMISDGAKLKSGVGAMGLKETDTPKNLGANLVFTLSRMGFASTFMQTKPRDDNQPQKDNMVVSALRLDKGDEIDGRRVHVLHYELSLAPENKKVAATLYVDVNTHLPVMRTIPAYLNLREEYQFKLNEKIDAKRFERSK
jgi:hypothetical protein